MALWKIMWEGAENWGGQLRGYPNIPCDDEVLDGGNENGAER